MSIESWKKEFYPEEADDVAARGDNREMLEFCIQKFNGTFPNALARHGLEKFRWRIKSDGATVFMFDARTCPLCCTYHNNIDGCDNCPLYEVTGESYCQPIFLYAFPQQVIVPLYEVTGESYCQSHVWNRFLQDDPQPMIDALKRALEMEKQK